MSTISPKKMRYESVRVESVVSAQGRPVETRPVPARGFDRLNPNGNEIVRRFLKQRGFSVPTAIFIIVILAALGAFLVTIGSGQQAGLAQDITGTRVFYGARSGLDWGIYQVVNTTGAYRSACDAGSTNTTLSSLSGMPGIVVLVACTSTAYVEGTSSLHSYQISATACNASPCPAVSPTSQYVERKLTAVVVN